MQEIISEYGTAILAIIFTLLGLSLLFVGTGMINNIEMGALVNSIGLEV